MSDDDSESDIETMFQDAHNNIARKTDERVDFDSDISDNDEKDQKNVAQLANGTQNPFYYSTKKRKTNASDKKQQHLSQLKAKQEQIDKLYSSKLQRITNEDDDDDFLDDDDVKVVGTSTAATTSTGVHNGMTTRSGTTTTTTTSTNTTKPPNYIDPAITLLDSDDDDDKNAGVPSTIHSRNIATTANISTTGSTTGSHRMMHHLNPTTFPTSYPHNNNIVMNSLYTAMIQGQAVPGMMMPPSSINTMMNQQVHQSQAISSQQQYLLQQIQQQRLQSAVANLMNPTILSIDEMVALNPSNQSSNVNSSLLRIKVIATIIPNQGSSIPISTFADLPIVDLTTDEPTQQHSSVFTQIKGSRTVSCVVDIIETSTIQILMDRILEHYLKLNLKQNVIGLRYNNEPMYPKHTLDMYRIPISGATIVATVQSSDTIHNNNNNNNTNNHGKQLVNASSFAAVKPKAYVPKGIVIHLLLRRSIMNNNNNNGKVTSEEISMSIGNLDPLQILVDQYRQKHCHNNNNGSTTTKNNKITLQFDGDTLILERTPKQYDMESDDLIDVIVS
jgi:hypothetical protein